MELASSHGTKLFATSATGFTAAFQIRLDSAHPASDGNVFHLADDNKGTAVR
jgi:hypothetical protein